MIDNEEEKNSNQLGNFKNKINEEHFYKKPDDTMAIFRNSVKKELKKLKLKKGETKAMKRLNKIHKNFDEKSENYSNNKVIIL